MAKIKSNTWYYSEQENDGELYREWKYFLTVDKLPRAHEIRYTCINVLINPEYQQLEIDWDDRGESYSQVDTMKLASPDDIRSLLIILFSNEFEIYQWEH